MTLMNMYGGILYAHH